MPVLDARAARVTVTVLLVCSCAVALWALRETVTMLIFAILLAYLLSPVVDIVDRYAPGSRSRTISLAIVYMSMLTIAGVALGWVITQAAQEATVLVKTLPAYLKDPQLIDKLPLPLWLKSRSDLIIDWVRTHLEGQTENLGPMLQRAGRGILWLAGNVIYLVLVPILSFFLLKDGHAIGDAVVCQFDGADRRRTAQLLIHDVHLVLANYMRAIVLQCLSSFAFFVVILHVMQVPYALLLSVIIGVLEIVPVAGPLVSAVVSILVALFAGYPNVLWLVLVFIVARLILDYGVQPYLMSQGVELPPLAVLIGVLGGEALGGILGIFLSIPVMAIARLIYTRYRERSQQRMASAQA